MAGRTGQSSISLWAFIALLMAAGALILSAGEAVSQDRRATEQNWLIGYWEGQISDKSKDHGDIYEIRVKSVNDDGTLQADWETRGKGGGIGQGKLENDTLILSFKNGNVTTLRHETADRLTGNTLMPSGRHTNDFTFVRKSPNADMAIKYGKGCTYRSYRIDGTPRGFRHLDEGNTVPNYVRELMYVCRNGRLVRL